MNHMNKGVMVIWFFTIVSLLGFILFIGYKKRDTVYLDLTESLEKATIKYVKKNNPDIKINERVIVFIDDLIEKRFIKEESKELIDKYCIKSVVFTRGLFDDNYTLNKNCDSKE